VSTFTNVKLWGWSADGYSVHGDGGDVVQFLSRAHLYSTSTVTSDILTNIVTKVVCLNQFGVGNRLWTREGAAVACYCIAWALSQVKSIDLNLFPTLSI